MNLHPPEHIKGIRQTKNRSKDRTMSTKAILKNARISAQKCRLIADLVRGKSVSNALDVLTASEKKGSAIVKKLLVSVIANAENNDGQNIDELKIAAITVNEGPTLKRIKPRAKGRANRIQKRTCHVEINVTAQ